MVSVNASQPRRRGNLSFCMGIALGVVLTTIVQWLSLLSDPVLPTTSLSAIEPPTTKQEKEGWHTINVYYGDKEKSEYVTNDPWVAQVHQDEAVIDLVGENGYFVDLAANHALELSNTFALEKHGWNGLCIEPNPVYWYGLSFRKCQVVGALVGARKEQVKVKFRGVYGGIVGKMDEGLANRKREPKAQEETRFTAPLLEVFQEFGVPNKIDYLSLDVEGAEFMIMKDFPFDQYEVSVMTVERPGDDLRKVFQENGYVFLKDLAWWGETLWAHKSLGLTPDSPKVARIPFAGKKT